MENDRYDVFPDGRIVWKNFPRISKKLVGKEAGTFDPSCGYMKMYSEGRTLLNHRVVWEHFHGVIPSGMCIDHIDGNRVNNSISNLRLIRKPDNQTNMGISKANTSGVLGVRYDRLRGKWVPSIKVRGKSIYLGRFENIEDAVAARDAANIKYGFHENHGARESWDNSQFSNVST